MNVENNSVQMRKGILEFCVMHIIARGEVYTSDLIQELTAARMVVVEGTLYPLLTRLKNAGLLQYAWRESTAGPPRKYYSLTDQGQASLTALTQTWQEISDAVEYLRQHQPSSTHEGTPSLLEEERGLEGVGGSPLAPKSGDTEILPADSE